MLYNHTIYYMQCVHYHGAWQYIGAQYACETYLLKPASDAYVSFTFKFWKFAQSMQAHFKKTQPNILKRKSYCFIRAILCTYLNKNVPFLDEGTCCKHCRKKNHNPRWPACYAFSPCNASYLYHPMKQQQKKKKKTFNCSYLYFDAILKILTISKYHIVDLTLMEQLIHPLTLTTLHIW